MVRCPLDTLIYIYHATNVVAHHLRHTDGMIVVWSPSDKPTTTYGSDTVNEEAEYSKEFWRARIIIRCTTREVYDLAWSPNSEWIVAGSTDNTARIFNAVDGRPVVIRYQTRP